MTEEDLKISELGAYTNNSMNREGLKKLVAKVNSGGGTVDAYTKAETDALLATKQGTLTAGDNVAISEENVISATDTKYTAGTNVSISEQNVISATDTVYTAGTGITISDQNVISASGGGSGEWTLRDTNSDWSDLFESNQGNTKYIAKKDMILYIDSLSYYICKGKEFSYNVIYDSMILDCLPSASGNKLYLARAITFNNSASIDGTNGNLRTKIRYATFSTDGTSVTFTIADEDTNTSKSSVKIYTKE